MLSERSVVLIGGQAVAIWVAQLEDKVGSVSASQVASRDIDFQGGQGEVQRAAELLGGRVRLPSFEDMTPITGVAIFVDSKENERYLDFLGQPTG